MTQKEIIILLSPAIVFSLCFLSTKLFPFRCKLVDNGIHPISFISAVEPEKNKIYFEVGDNMECAFGEHDSRYGQLFEANLGLAGWRNYWVEVMDGHIDHAFQKAGIFTLEQVW